MENETKQNRDPGGAKLKAWLLSRPDGTRVNLKDELRGMAKASLTDLFHQ
jgi:hypothetical protein